MDNSSKVQLFFPGEGRKGDGSAGLVEGIMQADATSEDIGKFCWVKRSGVTPCLALAGNVINVGWVISPARDGRVGGDQTESNIGQGLAATNKLTADALALVNLDIPDGPLIYAYANTQNGYNQVTIR